MKKQLLELYYSMLDEGCAPDSAYAVQLSKVVDLEDAVKKALPQPLRPGFDTYADALQKLAGQSSEDAFLYGYRTGARLMLAALLDVPS